MRQIVSALLVSSALAFTAGPALAKEKLDLSPLLDGLLEGCSFGDPLYDLIASLRPATREGGALAIPADYAAAAGEPTHETDQDGAQIYYLPLPGQWRGQPVAGIDFVNQDDAGLLIAAVRFVGTEADVAAQFDPLVIESQAILDQDEMSVDLAHGVALATDEGVTRLICDLST